MCVSLMGSDTFLPVPFLAELPLIDLMKLYEGAFLPSFQWPQPPPGGEETSEEEGVSRACRGSAPSSSLTEPGPTAGTFSLVRAMLEQLCVILYFTVFCASFLFFFKINLAQSSENSVRL